METLLYRHGSAGTAEAVTVKDDGSDGGALDEDEEDDGELDVLVVDWFTFAVAVEEVEGDDDVGLDGDAALDVGAGSSWMAG